MQALHIKLSQRLLSRVWGGYLCLPSLDTVFSRNQHWLVWGFNFKLQLALSCLAYSNCGAVHRVEATPVFMSYAIKIP